jgi:hypothetical protein
MTTIAYDGKRLAADRGLFDRDIRVPSGCDKMRLVSEYHMAPSDPHARALISMGAINPNGYGGPVVLTGAGTYEGNLILFDWWLSGADPQNWPRDLQRSDGRSITVVAGKGWCIEYGYEPVAQSVRGMLSWGAGAEMALGALLAGADAPEAVAICNKHHCFSGPGMNWVNLNDSEWRMYRT